MSIFDSFGFGDGYTDYGGSIGPQSDGTYSVPDLSVAAQPVDAGGGGVGQYSSQVLDIFKFGVGVWANQQSQQNMLDYKRYEAAGGGLYQQGNTAGIKATGNGVQVGVSNGMVMIVAAALALLLLTRKG